MVSYLRSEFDPVPVADEPFHLEYLRIIKKHADRGLTAFISAETGERKTYKDLLLASYCVNVYLKKIGFGNKDVVGAVLQNCWQFAPIFLGVVSRGGCLSGASPLFTEAELSQQFNDAKCRVIFCMEYSLELALKARNDCPLIKHIVVVDATNSKKLPPNVVTFDYILLLNPLTHELHTKVDVEKDMILLPYSSGTTGVPKGVMLTHKNFGTLVRSVSKVLDEELLKKMDPKWDWNKEYLVSPLPLYHMYGFGFLWINILNGAQTVILKKYNPEIFFRVIQEYKVRFVAIVPPILVFMANSEIMNNYDISSLEYITSSAAPVGLELITALKKRFPTIKQISQAYGMTEMSMSSHIPVFGRDNIAASGRLAPNYEMKIIDRDTHETVPLGTVGEILIRSPTVMLGYFNRPKATAETVDKEGWLHTGDLGYLEKDGWMYVVDRCKDLIKVKGLQVAPAELEDILLSHDNIKDSAVIGVPHPEFGEVPRAFVVKNDPNLTAAEVDRYILEKCAPYKRLLGGVFFVDEIPKSPSGKILRRQLRDTKSKL
ncbi:unnamed protein product [Bursaphelenchus xylophilus]|uniref:(pine wood nematode) hypothetical protein n=1 Tax=Bursaphelenchus xylophilus TaxID=6326 RepID=A0A1I7SC62_BURXY|nr:unnamed protein product [Bursaphelenchus xylophilus]CAG9094676.1 unnamed protein product [Bursaphelenchus xylophilus]